MNKTIIININGIVFHIEEDAYDVLIKYMNEVKKHFGYSADSYEIVGDIENRLAEMFTEKLAESGKEVIVLADVTAVTGQMGQPSDFDLADESSQAFEEPEVNTSRVERKLFRDTDDKIIGGVCAGVGHYFGVEPRWIRVILLLSFLLWGSGLFLYLVLWMAMPKAQTRADKMAMKGEAPNLQNFKKNFDEEMQSVKENLGYAQKEVRPFFQRLGRFIEQLFSHLAKFLGSAGKVILKIAGAFIVLIGIVILFSLFVGLLAVLGIWSGADLPVFPFNVVNPEYQHALYISAFIVVLVPLISLILFAVRVLFNRPNLNKNVSFGLLILWLIALSTGLYYGFRTGGEFKEEARFSQTTALKPYPAYYLELNKELFLTKEDSANYQIDRDKFKDKVIVNGNRQNNPNNLEIVIEKSDVSEPQLVAEYISDGKNFQNALESAKRIQYHFLQKDSSLRFDATFNIKAHELWRNQRVKIILKIPQNTRLIINPELNRCLNNYNLYDCMPEDKYVPSEWIMTNDGLSCKNDSLYKQNRLRKGLD